MECHLFGPVVALYRKQIVFCILLLENSSENMSKIQEKPQ